MEKIVIDVLIDLIAKIRIITSIILDILIRA